MQRRTSSRREFLQGQSALNALADLAEGRPQQPADAGRRAGPRPGPAATLAEPYLVQFGRRAMACQFEVFLNAGQYPHAGETAVEALDLVDRLEDQLTVYRQGSELMHVNRSAGQGPVEVEAGLFGLLERAVELHRLTDGAFDVTMGPLAKVWGFYRRSGEVPEPAALEKAMGSVGSQWIELDRQPRTVHFRRAGVELNLGAIGKGYALDRAAELVQEAGIHDFVLHGGNSSVLARGGRSSGEAKPAAAGWLVALEHPMRPGRRLAEIRLKDRALGTSGSLTQFFRHRGKRYGHLLDPRTGQPAQGVISATAVAGRAADADALATAFYVLGAQAARAYCDRHPEVGMLLVIAGRGPNDFEVVSAGLAGDDYRLVGEA